MVLSSKLTPQARISVAENNITIQQTLLIFVRKGLHKPLVVIIYLIVVLWSGAWSALHLVAQPLDSLLHEAYRTNPQYRAFEHLYRAAEYRAEAAGALPPPQAGVSAEQVPTGSFDVINGALSTNFYASQMLMLGGKRAAMQDAERVRAQTEHSRHAEFAAQLRMDITTAYIMLWRIDREREIVAKTDALLERSLAAGSMQVEMGQLSFAEMLRLQAEHATLELKTKTLANERTAAQTMLLSLIGRSLIERSTPPFSNSSPVSGHITPILPTASVKTVQAVEQTLRKYAADTLLRSNPTLKRMAGMIEMTRAETRAVNTEAAPDVMLQGMIMRMPQGMTVAANSPLLRAAQDPHAAPAAAPMRPDWMYSLMAQITLPFAPWSAQKYTAKAQELAATEQAQILEREAMTRMLAAQCEEQLQRMKTAAQIAETLEQTIIPLYERALEAQISALKTSQTSITSLLDTERMLLMKSEERIMAQEQFFQAKARLEALLGEVW